MSDTEQSWALIKKALAELYGSTDAEELTEALRSLASQTKRSRREPKRLTEQDAALITYANSIDSDEGKGSPLFALHRWIKRHGVNEILPIVHLLPFFPWDTDRGFSVIDFYRVHEDYGSWEDIRRLSKDVSLMFDFVANHASIDNALIQGALISRHLEPTHPRYLTYSRYADFVIAFSEETKPDESVLVNLSRPRPNPVLSPYFVEELYGGELRARLGRAKEAIGKVRGTGWVWTTFSRPLDAEGKQTTKQVDLNFKNPAVFFEAVRILLFYVEKGAELIRLDAIGYLWKKLGSSSLHEAETHKLLQTLHAVMLQCAPEVLSIAEVNEPQEMVRRYLGTPEAREADLVYQFSHFPLAVHAVHYATAKYYGKWLADARELNGRQFTTVLGSHDGIGMKPARGLLPEAEIAALTERLTTEHRGRPNYAYLPGGERIVYEVCATPWELINSPNHGEDFSLQLSRYRAVTAMGLIPRGIPAFYLNGLPGSENYLPAEGLDENRSVNRKIYSEEEIDKLFAEDKGSAVFAMIRELLSIRAKQPAFSPEAPAPQVLSCDSEALLAVKLAAKEPAESLVVVISTSGEKLQASVDLTACRAAVEWEDLLGSGVYSADAAGALALKLEPYAVLWLKHREK